MLEDAQTAVLYLDEPLAPLAQGDAAASQQAIRNVAEVSRGGSTAPSKLTASASGGDSVRIPLFRSDDIAPGVC
jgi:hypothetical protein